MQRPIQPLMLLDRPEMPLSRMVRDGTVGSCPACGSTMMRKRWLFFGARPGCIHPECKNYGGRNG
ncbi:hypothetical protein AB8810_12685 [Xanthomonas sp. NCPPB 3005]|uniref:hypothetical protein n=1 Tax=Xanthomonas sp. NCPPB 3005 TaxID=3240913 RepID=UPI003512BC3D